MLGPTLHQYALDDFLRIATSDDYRPKSNVDIFIIEPVPARDINRRQKMVEEFLVKMHALKPDLSNFRVVYPVTQSCCVFWRRSPAMVMLHNKVPTLPKAAPKFSIEYRVKSTYDQSVVNPEAQALAAAKVVDYGAARPKY